jgi:hypothetical protein
MTGSVTPDDSQLKEGSCTKQVEQLQGSDDDDKAVLYALHVHVTADESYNLCEGWNGNIRKSYPTSSVK